MFAGDADCPRSAVGKCKSLMVAARAAASTVYREALVIEQAPAELDFILCNGIGIGYQWRHEARRQLPIEFNLKIGAVFVWLTNGGAGGRQQGDAGNDAASPETRMNQRDSAQRSRVASSIG